MMARSSAEEAAVAATETRIRALESELEEMHTASDEKLIALERGGHSAQLQPPPAVNMDPFACLCWCKFRRIGQSYVLHERRVIRDGAVQTSLVLVGPHWIGVVVTLAIIVISTGAFLHQQCSQLSWHYTLATLVFCSATLYYLFETACRDPGIVRSRWHRDPKDLKDVGASNALDDALDRDQCVEHSARGDRAVLLQRSGESDIDSDPSVAALLVVSAGAPAPSTTSRRGATRHNVRICDVCGVEQDAYTEHCDDCDVCVAEYDHHCPWMGKCIGQKNMRAFKLFNVAWVLYVVFVLSVALQHVDWGGMAIERLERATNGSWMPVASSHTSHP